MVQRCKNAVSKYGVKKLRNFYARAEHASFALIEQELERLGFYLDKQNLEEILKEAYMEGFNKGTGLPYFNAGLDALERLWEQSQTYKNLQEWQKEPVQDSFINRYFNAM